MTSAIMPSIEGLAAVRPFLGRFYSDKRVTEKYAGIGCTVGDMLSYGYWGKSEGLESGLVSLCRWELEYVQRGFRSVPFDDFIRVGGGYGGDLSELLGIRMGETEAHDYAARRMLARLRDGQPLFDVTRSAPSADGSFSGTLRLLK